MKYNVYHNATTCNPVAQVDLSTSLLTEAFNGAFCVKDQLAFELREAGLIDRNARVSDFIEDSLTSLYAQIDGDDVYSEVYLVPTAEDRPIVEALQADLARNQ